MPRKAKEVNEEEKVEKAKKKSSTKPTLLDKSVAKNTTNKKEKTVNSKSKSSNSKKTSSSAKEKAMASNSSTEKNAVKKSSDKEKTATKKTSTAKKVSVSSKEKAVASKSKSTVNPTKAKKTSDKEKTITKKTSATKKASDKEKATTGKASTSKKASDKEKAVVSESKTAVKKPGKKTSTTKTQKNNKAIIKKEVTSLTKRKTTSLAKKGAVSLVKKETTSLVKKVTATPEYYDLPYHYDQTVVKVLAQTPKTLFVYWDVSEDDKAKLVKKYGENFFDNTRPFLRLINKTENYYFDVDVDDFANGWYIHVDNSKCEYLIELHRKQREFVQEVITAPVYITSSNVMETPNDHILFDTDLKNVYYRNVKTNKVTTKNMANLSFIKKMRKIYNIYDLYKDIYQDENIDEAFDLSNPTSGNPTSTFK